MPATSSDLFKCWNYNGGAVSQKKWWELAQLVYGGQFGKRGTKEFLKTKEIRCIKSKMNCILLFLFWCKENYVEETESLVDIIGSL